MLNLDQRWRLTGAAVVVVLAAGGALAAAGVLSAAPGHKPFHIGCSHHNHGPKWHESHGAILRGMAPEEGRVRRPAAAGDLAERSITGGRSRRLEP